jgi:hypothetical protein
MRQSTAKTLPGWAVVGSSVLMVPALVGVFYAAASATLFCVDGCSRNQATLAVTQLVVAGFGLVPLVIAVLAALRGSRGWTAALLAVAVATYAIWGVLNDALIHGWGNVP